MWKKTSPALVHMLQADAHTLVAHSLLNGDPLLKYVELSIKPKDKNWFLHMCHYIVIVLYMHFGI